MARERAGVGDAPNVLARAGGDVDAWSVGLYAGRTRRKRASPTASRSWRNYARVWLLRVSQASRKHPRPGEDRRGRRAHRAWGAVLIDPIRAELPITARRVPEFRPEIPVVAAGLGERAGVVVSSRTRSQRALVCCSELKCPGIGLVFSSFVDDPEVPIGVARAAEDAGLDGVFVYDHLFRRARDGHRRPALEGVALLGAVA